MNGFPPGTASGFPLLVCESGRRWCDAARRFIGPFQHAPGESAAGLVVQVRPIELQKMRAAIAGLRPAAILWELDSQWGEPIALTIAQVAAARPDVLQLAGISDHPTDAAAQLGLRLQEFGIRATARDPAELSRFAPLVHRFFQGATAESRLT